MANPAYASETKLEVRRMFAAPREKVFDAWTQREKVEKWMCRFPRHETRFTTSDAGRVAPMRWRSKIRKEKRLSRASRTGTSSLRKNWCLRGTGRSSPPQGEEVDEARDTLVTVEFEPRGIFTEVILTHEGLATAGQREAHSKGWNGCFDRLEEELKA